MLYKIVFSALVCAFFTSICFAQDINKNEFYVGYSHQRGDHTSLNGIEVSGVRNLSRYFGIRGDFSAAFRNRNFTSTVISGSTTTTIAGRSNNQIYNFLGGVQIKDNAAKSKFKPFAFALAGLGYGRFKNRLTNCSAPASNPNLCTNIVFAKDSSAGFAGAFGGGLDIKVSNKIDFRAIQVDYNPIYFGNGFRNNVRLGIGIVFH